MRERKETAASSGSFEDFEIFERDYQPLRRFAAVVADADIDPDDLVHDALVATLQRHRLSELDQPWAYLKRAIVNIAANRRRRAGRFRALLPRLASVDEIQDHYPSDLSTLEQLTPTDRAVVYLADVEGLPHDVIASELGRTSGTPGRAWQPARRGERVGRCPAGAALAGATEHFATLGLPPGASRVGGGCWPGCAGPVRR